MSQKKSIFSLLTVIFIDSVGWGVVYPVFAAFFFNHPSIINADTVFEIAIAVYSIFMFLFSPLLGALSDQYGRKRLLIVSMMGTGIGFGVSAIGIYLSSILVVLLGRAISGMAAGSLGISQAAIADLSNDENKAYRLGLIVLANGLGFTCGPLLGGILIKFSFSLYLPLLVTGLLAIIGMLSINYLFNDTHKQNNTAKIDLTTSLKNVLNLAQFQHLTKIFGCLFLAMLGYISFFNYLPLFLHTKYNFTGNQQGYFLAYYAIIFSFSLSYLFSKLLKYLSIINLVIVSMVSHIIFYFVCLCVGSISSLYFIIFPIAMFTPTMYVGIVTMLSNNSSFDEQGKVMGVVGSICALTWALGPLIVAASVKINFEMPVVISVLFLVLGLCVLIADLYQNKVALSGAS